MMEHTPRSPIPDSLTKRLWNNSIDLANEALNTEFIQGVVTGTLNPNIYGSYALQDLVYVHHVLDAHEIAKKRASGEVKQFVENKKCSYESYFKHLASTWHIASTDSISLGREGQTYSEFVKQVAEDHDPIYFVVAMIPCERLWVWLASQMQTSMMTTNVYRFWCDDNLNDHGARQMEDFIDSHADLLDEDIALQLYKKCMNMEINFFKSATKRAE